MWAHVLPTKSPGISSKWFKICRLLVKKSCNYSSLNYTATFLKNPLLFPSYVIICHPRKKFSKHANDIWISKTVSLQLPPNKLPFVQQRDQSNFGNNYNHDGSKSVLSVALLGGILLAYYVSHLEVSPVTNRKRFISINKDQLKQLSQKEARRFVTENQRSVVPTHDADYVKVHRIAQRILQANRDIEEIKSTTWKINVIKADTVNAFVMPDGSIFVFTGIISACDNEDQLAFIMSHEISHAVMSHSAEQMSNQALLSQVIIIPLVIVASVFPGATYFADFVLRSVTANLINLKFSRKLETEADVVGLRLAAKACYDVRESAVFWGKLSRMEGRGGEQPEIFSTHPSHETREHTLTRLIPDAIAFRRKCGCPALPAEDPRSRLR